MNPLDRRTSVTTAVATAAIALSAVLSGCSAGQVAQTATQEPAINGSAANVGEIALRNVHLQAVQESDFLQPGTAVELMFVAANNSPDTDDKLLGVASDVGQVTLAGDTSIPARSALIVGSPDGQSEATPMGSATPATAEVTLSKPITNGLNYTFTFDFEKAGRTTVTVPISAGESPRRQ